MADKFINSRIINKHDTTANWNKATTFVPKAGEIIIYTDVNKIKLGDGTTTVVNLPFIESLPEQSGQSGKFLTTDGSSASWGTVDLSSKIDNPETKSSGQYLKYNGTTWVAADVDALPSQSGQSGKYLTTDGTDASWKVMNSEIYDLVLESSQIISMDPITIQLTDTQYTAVTNANFVKITFDGTALLFTKTDESGTLVFSCNYTKYILTSSGRFLNTLIYTVSIDSSSKQATVRYDTKHNKVVYIKWDSDNSKYDHDPTTISTMATLGGYSFILDYEDGTVLPKYLPLTGWKGGDYSTRQAVFSGDALENGEVYHYSVVMNGDGTATTETKIKLTGGIPKTNLSSEVQTSLGLADTAMQNPSTEGTSGQLLTTDGAGGRTWTTIANATTSTNGLMSATDKTKLDGLNYDGYVVSQVDYYENRAFTDISRTVTIDLGATNISHIDIIWGGGTSSSVSEPHSSDAQVIGSSAFTLTTGTTKTDRPVSRIYKYKESGATKDTYVSYTSAFVEFSDMTTDIGHFQTVPYIDDGSTDNLLYVRGSSDTCYRLGFGARGFLGTSTARTIISSGTTSSWQAYIGDLSWTDAGILTFNIGCVSAHTSQYDALGMKIYAYK